MKSVRIALLLLALCSQSPFSFELFERRKQEEYVAKSAIIEQEPRVTKYVTSDKTLVNMEFSLQEA